MLIDAVCVVAAFALAFALRFDAPSDPFRGYLGNFLWLAPILVALRLGTNLVFHLYQRVWRYASIDEVQAILMAASVGSIVFGSLILALSLPGDNSLTHSFPRSIIGIEWLLFLAFLGGSRFSLRIIQASRWVNGHRIGVSDRKERKRVLIVGAGDAGAMVAKEMNLRPRLEMEPVGFIDDDPAKKDKWIHGIRVLGSRSELPELILSHLASEVVVAMPTAPGSVIREVVRSCERLGVGVLTIPGIAELVSGKVTTNHIRLVQVEDLLRREPASLDLDAMSGFLAGAVVLITGAGGSIGAELCRQIAAFRPAKLLLLGRGENSIYEIHTELVETLGEDTEIVPLIADVRDRARIRSTIAEHRPAVVFHAAAHKHVPLMEANPTEAVSTNILGTKILLDACEEAGVIRFVLVSTDKAVRPSSVMGATKRVAELLLQQTATRAGRPYVAVRFGNVLGSRGSVLPLFKRQIQAGGPVTVTHPEVTRYFMTIPEAVQLILQAAALGKGGEIFVLDMGQPMKIQDLALDLIRLSGLEPYTDVDIVYTGLRPGEKLYEELFTQREQLLATRNDRIFVSSIRPAQAAAAETVLQELSVSISSGGCPNEEIRAILARIVPEIAQPVSPAPL